MGSLAHRAFIAIVFVGAASSVVTRAQTPPLTVEAAEADGAAHPASTVTREQASYGEAFGPTDRRCVDAETHVMARSGEFVAGPFDSYILMVGTGKRKVWWTPRPGAMSPLLLRASKVGAPDVTFTQSFTSVVRNVNGTFFNTLVRFPEPGRWLVVVTSGTNWGCFLIDER